MDVREAHSQDSLADLYNKVTMPEDLIRAHINNDRAVMQAYGFNIKEMSETDCVAELMRMYQALTENENNKTK